ncbi:MAG: ABC transporter permease [Pseudomonadota bacterium]
MHYKWVILPTDFLLFLLLGIFGIFFLWARTQSHWRIPWQQIINRPLAVVAMTICASYLTVALLDSIHLQFRLPNQPGQTQIHYSPRIVSVLDELIKPIGANDEKTYAAPFASRLFTKETIETSSGKVEQVYLPLNYPNKILQASGRSKTRDITIRIISGLSRGVGIWLLLLTILVIYCRVNEYNLLHKSMIAFYLTLLIIIVSISVALSLGKAYHIIGTDKVGGDIFYAAIKSIRTGLIIGLVTSFVMLPFAILLGIMAGFFGGFVDDVIQYIYTTLSSIPGVLLIAASILSLQIYIANHPQLFTNIASRADARLLALCIILGITSWTSLCRLLRAETLKLREMEYIQAAKVLGVSRRKILFRHILPNVLHIIIITVALDFSGLVLAEAVLSYVGVGVDPTTYSWGNMINSARLELARDPVVWWPLLSAFFFMFLLVLSANIFADALRDAFDPRLRQR